MSVVLGAIADDFTGATDLANTLVTSGMRAVQVIGVPTRPVDLGNAEAVVVALKSRTAPLREAIDSSVGALQWLRELGARQYFFKYCSTFDSTAAGNIGPVADALLDVSGADFAVVCPAFPKNKRTVYQGHLFVGPDLLSESPMKDHPLTPMRDANLMRLMAAQSTQRVDLVPMPVVSAGVSATREAFESLRKQGVSYAVVDALSEADLMTIGEAAASHKLITGGSGVALGLAANFREQGLLGPAAAATLPQVKGRAVVLAGSCSQATRAQIGRWQESLPSLKLDADRIADKSPVVEEALAWAAQQRESDPVLIYGSADPAEVAAVQEKYGRERAGAMIEGALGGIATGLVENGVRRIIVAGGETSGAVVSALGIAGLRIGTEIDPGVPWTETLGEPRIALALKSGNFGADDFFTKAFAMLP